MTTSVKLINIMLYQMSWFACILGAANAQPWFGVGVSLIVLAWHLWQASKVQNQLKNEIYLLLIAGLIGFVFDQALLSANLVEYASHGLSDTLVPAWILALWLTFATLLNVSLRWMRSNLVYAVVFGLLGGPLAYFAAEALQAITLLDDRAYWVLAIGWGIVTPVLIVLSKRFDGFAPQPAMNHMEVNI
jgi:hypothetical protein